MIWFTVVSIFMAPFLTLAPKPMTPSHQILIANDLGEVEESNADGVFNSALSHPHEEDLKPPKQRHPGPRRFVQNFTQFLRTPPLENPPPKTTHQFATHGDWPLYADAYLPAGEAPEEGWPSAMIVHGSGFLGGSKDCKHVQIAARELTDRGIAAVSVDYRKIIHTHLPFPLRTFWKNFVSEWFRGNLELAVDDVKQAVQWWQQSAKEFSANPNQVALLGFSAGGKIAALAAEELKDSIAAQILVSPPSDPSLLNTRLSRLLLLVLFGKRYVTSRYIDYSPMTKHFPGPTLLIHGRNDVLTIPHHTFHLFRARVEQGLGQQTYAHIEDQEAHGFWNDPDNSATKRVLDLVARFLKNVVFRDDARQL